jgi:hypothetical protein
MMIIPEQLVANWPQVFGTGGVAAQPADDAEGTD